MSRVTRRSFLKGSLAMAGATFAISGTKSSGQIVGANDAILVGVAGLHGRGGSHVSEFGNMEGVRIAYLIDPDTRTWKGHAQRLEEKYGKAPKTVQDVRKALEDKDLDVITIATPNHWHSLMTIWACQAGKDVYVEKPLSHEVHEGRIAVETARKYNRIVQHGTQSRSDNLGLVIQELAKQGTYGKLLISRGLCYKTGGGEGTRGDIGFKQPKEPPAEFDFNLWLGPAPRQPYHENIVHYRWHWFWDFGNGDIGNQGVHEMDKARWGIPNGILPKSTISVGGRIGHKDQGQTPSSQIAVLDYGDTQLIFEVRGFKSDSYHGQGVGNTYHFEAGIVAGGKFLRDGKGEGEPLPKMPKFKRGPGKGHFGNFIAAVRSRKIEDLNADVLEGHLSCVPIHLANISYRLGDEVPFTPRTKAFGENKAAYDALERMEEYLVKNGFKLNEWTLRVGKFLKFDAATETFKGNGELDEKANALLTHKYREPFVVPDKVV